MWITINTSYDESIGVPSILADNGSENEHLPSDSDLSRSSGKSCLFYFTTSNSKSILCLQAVVTS